MRAVAPGRRMVDVAIVGVLMLFEETGVLRWTVELGS